MILALARGASWNELAGMLRTLTAEPPAIAADPALPSGQLGRSGAGLRQVTGYQSGLDDLFAVANAIAALVEAPVTIEDRSSRLLAFSSRQEEVDTWRVQTILRRQVPEHYTRILEQRGDFQEIYRSTRPVFVPPIDDSAPDGQGRAAIAVRAGDEILGTIWAVADQPLDEEHSQALYDGAKLVAMHLVWQRADADIERRLRAELLSTALEGGPRTVETLQRLGLKDEPAVVLALTVVGCRRRLPLPAQLAVERKRLADAFALHLTAVHPRAAAGLVGDVAYAILPVARGRKDSEERAVVIASELPVPRRLTVATAGRRRSDRPRQCVPAALPHRRRPRAARCSGPGAAGTRSSAWRTCTSRPCSSSSQTGSRRVICRADPSPGSSPTTGRTRAA